MNLARKGVASKDGPMSISLDRNFRQAVRGGTCAARRGPATSCALGEVGLLWQKITPFIWGVVTLGSHFCCITGVISHGVRPLDLLGLLFVKSKSQKVNLDFQVQTGLRSPIRIGTRNPSKAQGAVNLLRFLRCRSRRSTLVNTLDAMKSILVLGGSKGHDFVTWSQFMLHRSFTRS